MLEDKIDALIASVDALTAAMSASAGEGAKPAKPAKAAPAAVTIDTVRAALTALIAKTNMKTAKDALAKHKVTKVSDAKPELYPALLATIEEMMNEEDLG